MKIARKLLSAKIAFLILVFSIFLYIVAADAGNSYKLKSGAGDIWWVQVEEVEEAYQSLKSKE